MLWIYNIFFIAIHFIFLTKGNSILKITSVASITHETTPVALPRIEILILRKIRINSRQKNNQEIRLFSCWRLYWTAFKILREIENIKNIFSEYKKTGLRFRILELLLFQNRFYNFHFTLKRKSKRLLEIFFYRKW